MWGWIVKSVLAPLVWNLFERWAESFRKWMADREAERIAKAQSEELKKKVKELLKEDIRKIQNDPNLSPIDKELELEKKFTEGFLKLRGH